MTAFRHETARLIMRDWRESDAADFHLLHSDPLVMKTLGPLRDMDYTVKLIADLRGRAHRNGGFTFWATELRETGRVIGFCGLDRGHVEPIIGELEIGWRLASDCWGQGYATEAAEACLAWANANIPGERCVAITAKINVRSQRVMERIGMVHCASLDFEHPAVDPESQLRPHVTYAKEPPL